MGMAAEPYYEQDGITLYCGDCRVDAPSIDLSEAQMLLADPPYGETSLAWDRWPLRWVEIVAECVPSSCSFWCFGSMRMFLDRRDAFDGWDLAQDVIWEKHNGTGFHVDRFRRVHELAVHFYRGPWADVYKSPQFTLDATKRAVRKKAKPAHWQGAIGPTTYVSEDGGPRLMRSVIHVRSEHGRAVHPTQKPLGILRPLIEYSSAPGGLIVVPFAGSGSELVAAKECGRRAIGFEIDEANCRIAVDRLKQGHLFGAASA